MDERDPDISYRYRIASCVDFIRLLIRKQVARPTLVSAESVNP
jgi:hypothetical protein